ncbi:MAG: SDR family oxidoreductase [Henriciella sp.]|nr:SDR family oxidoreductase [Henriciella sp.]
MEKPVTLVIGLGQTVGEALVRRFLDEGHDVLAVDPNQASLDNLSKVSSDKVELHHGAVHTRLGLRNALAAALEAYGQVNNVVLVPELPEPDTLLGLEMEDFETILMKTVRASVQGIRVFSNIMKEQVQDPGNAAERRRQAGTFTFVLSLGAKMAQPGWFSESVTQHAVLAVIKSAALELAPDQIRVNGVVALRPRAEGREPWLRDRTPVGRTAIGEEIAETAVFLSSPASSIITGEAIILDGGRRHLSGLIEQPDG